MRNVNRFHILWALMVLGRQPAPGRNPGNPKKDLRMPRTFFLVLKAWKVTVIIFLAR